MVFPRGGSNNFVQVIAISLGGTTIAVKSEVTGGRNVCSASEVLPGSSCDQNIESQGKNSLKCRRLKEKMQFRL